jgi:transcriptional regulator with XRE-family HTH domain
MKDKLVIALGKQLKILRIESGIKQKDLSNKLKIPAPLLSMYETGKREPHLEFLSKYSKQLKIPLSKIFLRIES